MSGVNEELLNKAIDQIENGEYDSALEALKYFHNIDPGNHEVVFAMAVCYIKNGDTKTGTAYARKAVKMGNLSALEIIPAEPLREVDGNLIESVSKELHIKSIDRAVDKNNPTPRQQKVDYMRKFSCLLESINLKILAVFVSIVILFVSAYLLLKSFEMKNDEANRFSVIPPGAVKIDNKTGERWIVTPYGDRKIEQKRQ